AGGRAPQRAGLPVLAGADSHETGIPTKGRGAARQGGEESARGTRSAKRAGPALRRDVLQILQGADARGARGRAQREQAKARKPVAGGVGHWPVEKTDGPG